MTPIPLTKDCFVTSVTLAAVCKLGLGVLDMDPLTLRDACEHVFGLRKMPQRMFDKLNCGLMLLGTTSYTDTIEGFLVGTSCMNNRVVDSDTVPYCTLPECSWGVYEYAGLNGDVDSSGVPTEKFSSDIVKYVQEAGKVNGAYTMPPWLSFAQDDGAIPDLSEDVQLFEQFMQRQEMYRKFLMDAVATRSKALKAELETLRASGYIKAENALKTQGFVA